MWEVQYLHILINTCCFSFCYSRFIWCEVVAHYILIFIYWCLYNLLSPPFYFQLAYIVVFEVSFLLTPYSWSMFLWSSLSVLSFNLYNQSIYIKCNHSYVRLYICHFIFCCLFDISVFHFFFCLLVGYLNIIWPLFRIPFWFMCSNFKCISSSFLNDCFRHYISHFWLITVNWYCVMPVEVKYGILTWSYVPLPSLIYNWNISSVYMENHIRYYFCFNMKHSLENSRGDRMSVYPIFACCILFSLPISKKTLILFLTFCLEIFTSPFIVDLLMTLFFCLFVLVSLHLRVSHFLLLSWSIFLLNIEFGVLFFF